MSKQKRFKKNSDEKNETLSTLTLEVIDLEFTEREVEKELNELLNNNSSGDSF